MAALYPPGLPSESETTSEAERRILLGFEGISRPWHVLHSLWLKTHKRKLHAEADFVVITERALLVIEAKGGDLWRDDSGQWHFRNRFGQVNVKREGPFEQAHGAYEAIRSLLVSAGRVDLFRDYTWGYGVITPNCVLQVPSNDSFATPTMVLDARGFPDKLEHWVGELEQYWETRRPPTRKAIPSSVRQEMAAHLRPCFGIQVSSATRSIHSDKELIKLTNSQLLALDFMSREPRNILVGAAGTGKTVLAEEQARRQLSKGSKVLVVCFNRLLAAVLRERLSDADSSQVLVGTYHQIVSDLCRQKGVELPFGSDWQAFQDSLNSNAEHLVAALDEVDLYDYLIVDEGQDLT